MKKWGWFLILLSFYVGTLPVFAINKKQAKEKTFTVVLDAGHGGHDPGNMGNGFKEKDIALKIVLQVGKILEARKDIKVVYTRKDDSFIDLYKRGKIANDAQADLFVSVHCNAHHSQAQGTETWVLGLHANKQNFEVAKKENSVIYLEDNHEVNYAGYDINSPESIIGLTMLQEEHLDQSVALAKFIQDSFTNQLNRVNRGVKQAGFIVLHQSFMPSVLIEVGFLSNKDEGRYLNSSAGQQNMANSIAASIIKYKNLMDETAGPEPEIQLPVITQTESPSEENTVLRNDNGVVYKVQIEASSKKVALKPSNFKGLPNISFERFNNLYRYMYGETSSYSEAQNLQKQAIAKGYSSSFIVAYRNGTKISVEEALKLTTN